MKNYCDLCTSTFCAQFKLFFTEKLHIFYSKLYQFYNFAPSTIEMHN